MRITILTEHGAATPASARRDGEALWLDEREVEATTGWTMRPEGLCRGAVCVPAPPGERDAIVKDGAVDIAAFWRRMEAPLAVSEAGDVWVLGEPAEARAGALDSLMAPDVALPDSDGRVRRLSEHLGKKLLLATWSSW